MFSSYENVYESFILAVIYWIDTLYKRCCNRYCYSNVNIIQSKIMVNEKYVEQNRSWHLTLRYSKENLVAMNFKNY